MTPAERGITNKDDLLLLEITDHHPVLLQFASAVMRQRGSAVPDSWVQEIMTGKSTVANAKRDTLDLETKKGCEKKKNALAYICWQGNPGAVHRDGLQNPPADIGVDAWHALQTDLDTYGKCVRDCIQAHQGGDTWKSSSSSTSKDKQWTWFLGLLYSKHWAVFSFQFTDELLMQMPRCKRDREQLAVERLESFRHAGHIDLDGTSSVRWGTWVSTPPEKKPSGQPKKKARASEGAEGMDLDATLARSNLPQAAKEQLLTEQRNQQQDLEQHGRKMYANGVVAGVNLRVSAVDSKAAAMARGVGGRRRCWAARPREEW
jgi:hypothetical protein